MNKTLLISEVDIKEYSNISDNLAGKYLRPAIYDAQFIDLQETIGSTLLNKLIDLVDNKTIDNPENKAYKELLEDYVYNFLIYGTMSNLAVILSYKIANFGIANTDDDHLTQAEFNQVVYVKDYYKAKQDFYKARLQNYISENKKLFNLNSDDVKANLYSSSSSPIFLGGYVGNNSYRNC